MSIQGRLNKIEKALGEADNTFMVRTFEDLTKADEMARQGKKIVYSKKTEELFKNFEGFEFGKSEGNNEMHTH